MRGGAAKEAAQQTPSNPTPQEGQRKWMNVLFAFGEGKIKRQQAQAATNWPADQLVQT